MGTRTGQRLRLSFGAWVAVIGLMATLGFGTYWAASAIVDGDSAAALIRVSASGLVGAYYVLLFQAYSIRGSRSS